MILIYSLYKLLIFLFGGLWVLLFFSLLIMIGFIVARFYINRIEYSLLKKYFSSFVMIIVILLIFLIVFYRREYTPDRWHANEVYREYFIDDMISELDLPDLNEYEIIDLLGEPDDEQFKDKFNDSNFIVYFIGYTFDDDQEYLIIEFDKVGKVISYSTNPYGRPE